MANFFEKLGDSVSKGFNSASQKANDLVELNKLNSEKKQAQQKKDADFAQLGHMLYDHIKTPGSVEPDYSAVIADMDQLDATMKNLQDQINALRNMQVCPSCNSEVPAGTAFCPKCGAKMPVIAQPQQQAPATKVCPNCGKPNGLNDKFCQFCGTPLPEAAPQQPFMNQAPVQNQFGQAPVQNQFEQAPVQNQFEQAPVQNQFEQAPVQNQFEQAPAFTAEPVDTTAAEVNSDNTNM